MYSGSQQAIGGEELRASCALVLCTYGVVIGKGVVQKSMRPFSRPPLFVLLRRHRRSGLDTSLPPRSALSAGYVYLLLSR